MIRALGGWVLVILLVIAASSCSTASPKVTAACLDAPPSSLSGAQQGVVEGSGGDHVSLLSAYRDASTIVVGLCLSGTAAPPDVTLTTSTTTDRSIGAIVAPMQSDEGLAYLYFAPRPESAFHAALDGRDLGVIHFDAALPSASCRLHSSSPDFVVEACGSLVVTRWQTGRHVTGSVDLVDASVVDTSDDRPLGFYLLGTTELGCGLEVRMAFHRPSGTSVGVTLNGLIVDGQSAPPNAESTRTFELTTR